jgi:diadenosine tetraphosphate (Ap4A) HIT family hydrolase
VSFHDNLERWRRWCKPEHCPVCLNEQPPGDTVTIRETEFSWLEAHPRVCLPGTCYVLSKIHAVELYDLSDTALAGFMTDVQDAARALKQVTGAVKINYEIHGNTVPHLHVHLFPRSADDPFLGQPIHYEQTSPPVYGEGDFERFIRAMQDWFARIWERERR